MTSKNETISRQNLWLRNIAAISMTSEGNSALLPADVDRPLPLQRGLMNFQLQNFQLYNVSLKDWSLWKQLILFPLNLNVSVIKCLLFYNLAKLISLYRSSEELENVRAKLRLDFRFSYPVKAYAWI